MIYFPVLFLYDLINNILVVFVSQYEISRKKVIKHLSLQDEL